MKQTFGMFLCVGVGDHNEGKYHLESYNPESTSIGTRYSALVNQVDVEVDVPDGVNVIDLKLKALEESLEKDKKASALRQAVLADQISKLKCLTHEV